MRSKELGKILDEVKKKRPLVHSITNNVVTNFTANGLLSMGASPVMTTALEEAEEMASAADVLVLNIGTLYPAQVEAMLAAGKAANQKGVPVILDPVGAGATSYRTTTVHHLLERITIDLLRGNAAEISAVAGLNSDIRGVDAAGGEKNIASIALHAAKTLNVPAAVTGPVDAVSDGKQVYRIHNGHSMLTKVTGSGCLATAVIGAFSTVIKEPAKAAAAALGFYGVASERAEGFASMQGPGTFQEELLNALYHVGEMDFRQHLNIKTQTAEEIFDE
ncbi:hydroxyethylthiazole kinase [Alteribacillus sp. HJP-4]|uniref:hydroxyethylthiazole kinase n=1 Tax=Alteribacillus sp. HJP-4 TaxID=2775394 RepID=UPI0035CCF5A6